MLNFSFSAVVETVRQSILPRLSIRFDKSPIDTVEKAVFFIHTRSAYVAQTSLYGYLKTRMGTKFRDLFTDDEYVKSINFAKWRVYGACLSDLTVFVCALIGKETNLGRDEAVQLAEEIYRRAVQETYETCEDATLPIQLVNTFHERAEAMVWANAAIGEAAFTKSQKDLITYAPIADELKRLDERIVRNSIRFRWRDVRNQMRQRLRADAIVADFGTGSISDQGALRE